jgi:hypothetical protein
MARVSTQDVALMNELIVRSDEARNKVSTTLITIYGAATSGLFTLIIGAPTSIASFINAERILFLTVLITSVLIVFISIMHKILTYFSIKQVGEVHAQRMREERTHIAGGLFPNHHISSIILAIPFMQSFLILTNIASIAGFGFLKVL